MKKIDAITTFLGHDAIIDGTIIEFKGVIRVDGEITGKVQSDDGTIIVGEKAVINGDIAVGNAIVTGEVNGNIDAKSRVEIYSPGRVMGDIQAAVISIDPGSFFNGKCMMTSKMAPQKKSEFFQDKSIAVDDSEGKEKKSKKL
ncbi:MAG: polymer-forming cytoskeletal protein [Deltaproteobacteria bacterium]|nr:polymer-forming cytoskeletal protein [Deltaproteobacteria bacterium]